MWLGPAHGSKLVSHPFTEAQESKRELSRMHGAAGSGGNGDDDLPVAALVANCSTVRG